jgi:hypothetical protein
MNQYEIDYEVVKPIQFPQFNPLLGTLQSVEFVANGSYPVQFSVQNPTGGTLNGTASLSLETLGVGTTLLALTPTYAVSLGPNGSGTAKFTSPASTLTRQASHPETNFPLYVGTGSITLNPWTRLTFADLAPRGFNFTGDLVGAAQRAEPTSYSATVNVSLIYNFTPDCCDSLRPELKAVDGDVLVTPFGLNTPYYLHTGERVTLRPGDRAHASSDPSAHTKVTFPDGSRLEFDPGAEFTLDDAGPAGPPEGILGLIRGFLQGIFNGPRVIRTRTATPAVRGTEYTLDVDEGEMFHTFFLNVSSGIVDVTDIFGGLHTVSGGENLSLSFLIGDYNGDGIVDAADYVVWRKTFGETALLLAADGDGSGTVDAGDFDVWRDHFGNTIGSGAAYVRPTVPEPATSVLLYIGLAGYCFIRAGRARTFVPPAECGSCADD